MQQTEVSTKTLCDICGKEGAAFFSRTHSFLKTCAEHNEYHNVFNVEKIRFDLGLIPQIPDCNCAICEKPLSEDEKHSMGLDDFIKTCAEHRIFSSFYNIDRLRIAYKRNQLPTELIPKKFPSECWIKTNSAENKEFEDWKKTENGQRWQRMLTYTEKDYKETFSD